MGPIAYEIIGANRGGKEHVDSLLTSPAGALIESVRVADPTPGRARDLAGRLSSEGREIDATYLETKAPVESEADIRAIAIDDAQDTADILSAPTQAKLTECTLVVAANTQGDLGGTVRAIGTTLTARADETQAESDAVFGRIAELSPGRRTSKNITDRILNSPQVKFARRGMHDHFSAVSTQFAVDGEQDLSSLWIASGDSGAVSQLDAIEAPHKTLRRDLKRIAVHDVLAAPARGDEAMQRRTVVFYNNAEPRLYFVEAVRSRSSWVVMHTYELPVVLPVSPTIDVSEANRDRDDGWVSKAREVVSETFVTD